MTECDAGETLEEDESKDIIEEKVIIVFASISSFLLWLRISSTFGFSKMDS